MVFASCLFVIVCTRVFGLSSVIVIVIVVIVMVACLIMMIAMILLLVSNSTELIPWSFCQLLRVFKDLDVEGVFLVLFGSSVKKVA